MWMTEVAVAQAIAWAIFVTIAVYFARTGSVKGFLLSTGAIAALVLVAFLVISPPARWKHVAVDAGWIGIVFAVYAVPMAILVAKRVRTMGMVICTLPLWALLVPVTPMLFLMLSCASGGTCGS